jgi:Xaa-Pro aminopeptidase
MDDFVRARLRSVMRRHGFDGLVAFSKENVAYSAGYVVPSQHLGMRNRHFSVALNGDGKAAMLLTTNEIQEAQARGTISHLQGYDEFADDPMEALASMLSDLGLTGGRLGLELDALPAQRWERLKQIMPSNDLRPGDSCFQEARMIKSPRERDLLRQAAAIADRAQRDAHEFIRKGMSEQEVYRLLMDRALANGAEDVLMIQVASGERSTFSNPTPSQRCLEHQDVVKIDIFVSASGYLSDTGRSVVVGEPSRRQRNIWARLQETLQAVEERIRQGASIGDVWGEFQRRFEAYSMAPAIRFLGHGLGLSLHEEPFITAQNDGVLEAGMALALEPVYSDGASGYHIEDNVLVTDDGVENLTTLLPRDLIVVDRRGQ